MIATHSAIHLVRCYQGQMSLIAVSYPIIFIHDLKSLASLSTVSVKSLTNFSQRLEFGLEVLLRAVNLDGGLPVATMVICRKGLSTLGTT